MLTIVPVTFGPSSQSRSSERNLLKESAPDRLSFGDVGMIDKIGAHIEHAGTDFPYQQFFPKDATVVQIDVRGEQLGRRTKVDFGFVGDTKATIRALLPHLSQNQFESHLKKSLEHYQKTRKGLDDLATANSGKGPIHPQYVARVLDKLAAEDAIFTCDVGTPTVWAARYLKMNGKRRLLGSFTHGSMANALPQAIGAQVSHPGRQVISMSGDGGFAMVMGDLLSLRQLELPVKVIVFK